MDMRKYGVGTTFLLPMIKFGLTAFAGAGDWTPAVGDVKVLKNDGSIANIATLPTSVGKSWLFTLSAAEVQAARVDVQISDLADDEVEDQFYKITTYGHASAQHETFPADAEKAAGESLSAMAELTGVPSATPSLVKSLMTLFMPARNKMVSDSNTGEIEIYNSAGSKIIEQPFTDAGSIFTRSKMETPD